jgi:hypothetical protein
VSRHPAVTRQAAQVGAPIEALAELHKALAVRLAELLSSGKARASHMMVIRAFLKDNGIKVKSRADQLSGLGDLANATIPTFTN